MIDIDYEWLLEKIHCDPKPHTLHDLYCKVCKLIDTDPVKIIEIVDILHGLDKKISIAFNTIGDSEISYYKINEVAPWWNFWSDKCQLANEKNKDLFVRVSIIARIKRLHPPMMPLQWRLG